MSARSRVPRVGVLVVLVAGLLAVLPTPSSWVEELYSRRIYLIGQNILTPLSSAATFALFDLLLVGVLVGTVGWWLAALVRADRGCRLRAAATMAFNTAVMVAGIYVAFLLVWGFNYRREPLTTKLDYDPSRVTPHALVDLTAESVDRLNELYGRAHLAEWSSLEELPVRLGPAFEQVQRQLGGTRTAVTGDPKASILTPYFRRAGIDGMISPFSLEILVNETVLPFERPYIVAHEWAHLAGFADESEASFVGWLTCLVGDDSSRYSAWLFVMPRLMQHLGEEERGRLWARMAPGPTTDLRAVADRLSAVVPVVQRNANRVYDRYLKANRVEAGVASYGAVVDLILGTRFWQGVG